MMMKTYTFTKTHGASCAVSSANRPAAESPVEAATAADALRRVLPAGSNPKITEINPDCAYVALPGDRQMWAEAKEGE